MKKSDFDASSFPVTFFYTAILTVSSIFCPITAFNIPAQRAGIFLFCLISSFLIAGCMSFRKYWLSLAILMIPYLLFFFIFRQTVLAGLGIALETVTNKFSAAYDGYKTISLSLGNENVHTATLFLMLLGALISVAVAWTVARRHSPWIVLLVCFPYLDLCLFIVKYLPALWAIFAMLSSFALLVMTQGLRRQNHKAENYLTLKLFVPMMALVLALSAIFPYSADIDTKWAYKTQQRLNSLFDDLSFVKINSVSGQLQFNPDSFNFNAPGLGVWKPELERVDLSAVGPQSKNGIRVMQIKASESGVLYLRGVSLARYENNAWTALDSEAYRDLGLKISPLTVTSKAFRDTESLQIKTLQKEVLLYSSYYLSKIPSGHLPVDDAYIDNTDGTKSYKITYAPESGSPSYSSIPDPSELDDYEIYVCQYYTYVPPDIADMLMQLAKNAGLVGLSCTTLPQAVAAYVCNYAVYDLKTANVPEGQDFALWFLTHSHRGYCTHFATASALLLRTLGIPARYVTGYMVNATADDWVYVTDDNAHAWVEYYVSGLGWVPLESTVYASGYTSPETEISYEDTRPETTVPDEDDPPSETTPTGVSTSAPPAEHTTPGGKTLRVSKYWLFALLPFAVALLLLWAYSFIVLKDRYRRFQKGDPNRRAIAIWKHIVRMSILAGEDVPDALRELAQKAKFSQHKLTKAELGVLLARASELTDTLSNTKNTWRKLYYRFILAVI